jgi:hypothetical protein
MNDIHLDTLPEPYRKFLRGVAADPNGSVIKEHGRELARVLPAATGTNGTADNWTEQKNERRCALIRKKFSQGLDSAEARELAELQDEVSAYRKRVVQLPFDAIDTLEAALGSPSAPTL